MDKEGGRREIRKVRNLEIIESVTIQEWKKNESNQKLTLIMC